MTLFHHLLETVAMISRHTLLPILVLFFIFFSRPVALEANEAADLVLHSGIVHTVNDDQPQAEAVAIRGDRIVAVGTTDDMRAWIGDETKVIDLGGRTVVPGFTESHGHLLGLGALLSELNLTEARSWEEIVGMVVDAAAKSEPGEWIVGRGWHQSLWEKKPIPDFDGYPTHQALSAAVPDNPVLLVHRSGHMSFANQKAMDEAGVSHSTEAPSGGEIPRDDTGAPIGVFRETAQSLIRRALSRAEADRTAADLQARFDLQLDLAQQECLSKGVTSFHDAGVGQSTVERYVRRIEQGRLDLRMWVMLRAGNTQLRRMIPELKQYQGYGNHRLTVGGIKQMVDGALGAHGAWLLEPYSDLSESTGLVVTPVDVIREAAKIAREHDLQLCVHAIGDRANREMLDLFEEFYRDAGEDGDLRWRIEHAQHLHPDDIPRFGDLGVIASMQANHCTSDGPFVPSRLGPQRTQDGAYVWQSLLSSGAVIANGTDAPVEPVDPLRCFAAAVTRRLADGSQFYPDEAMSREQALRAYTLDAAYAAKQEKILGSIEPGKLADLVVLSHDLLSVPDDQLADMHVEMTLLGGQLVYQREQDE